MRERTVCVGCGGVVQGWVDTAHGGFVCACKEPRMVADPIQDDPDPGDVTTYVPPIKPYDLTENDKRFLRHRCGIDPDK